MPKEDQGAQPQSPTILVPVDFSSNSKKALRYAGRLALKLEARLEVLHVIHDPADAPGYYAQVTKKKAAQRLEDGASEMMEDFLKKASKDEVARPAIQSAVVQMVMGTPVKRILEVEEALEPIMIVVGSQGRTGLSRLLLGSKAAQLIRLCKTPVLVVKD